MQQWRYRVVYYQTGTDPNHQGWNIDGQLDREFNYPRLHTVALDALGAQGWELVSVVKAGTSEPVFYLKQPK